MGQGVAPSTVDTERGEPKVWLPGEGWVVVEPMEDMQEAGYAADSEDTMQRDVQDQNETRTVPGAPSERPADDTVRRLLQGPCPHVKIFSKFAAVGVSQCYLTPSTLHAGMMENLGFSCRRRHLASWHLA